jgi:hypothetical protein
MIHIHVLFLERTEFSNRTGNVNKCTRPVAGCMFYHCTGIADERDFDVKKVNVQKSTLACHSATTVFAFLIITAWSSFRPKINRRR